MISTLKITEEKLKILRKNPELIKRVEDALNVKIEIEDGVKIIGRGLEAYKARMIMKAFGRCFSMDDALLLLDDEYGFVIIDVRDYAKSRNRQIVLKGRVIGEKGKTKRYIEGICNVKISVYGKTISIIGKWEDLEIAKRAIEMLLEGRMHSTVYRFLETQKSMQKLK